jgi:glutamate synthase (NADPH) large chain
VVVEGIGDHGCEYMTGGLTIILGQTGRNFAAGMSGGVAYVWDLNGDFRSKVNGEMVAIENLNTEDLNILRMYVENHLEKTQSDVARQILEHWESLSAQFLKVLPTDFKTALSKRGLTLTDQLADKSIVYQNIQVAVKI